ncbi:MAG: hypothetical protein C0627_09195 [Sulfurimonas sp.]|nr:MAG: hypothetical protein C0627_09195 [Sulfurimonas sp.]
MHIAIDVNDTSIANKILDFLKNFNQEIDIRTSKDDADFIKNRDSLHKIYKEVTAPNHNLQKLDDTFWDDMDNVIKNA